MGGALRRLAAALALVALAAPATAGAQAADPGGFRNVLAVGQGANTTAFDFAANTATGKLPPAFTNQLALYRDLGPQAQGVTAANLPNYFKDARLGVDAADVVQTITPRPGVTIKIDRFDVPHVFGQTRSDVEYGAGYASARARLFMMEVLRNTARGTLTQLIGPGKGNANLKMDVQQLQVADYSEAELQRMIDTAAQSAGPEGAAIKQDLNDYTAGINKYIAEARVDPTKAPFEYAATGTPLRDWKPTDSAAIASLIGGIFGRGGGAETRIAAALQAARKRFGRVAGGRVLSDFRALNDPEAPVTTARRFPFPDPPPVVKRVRRGKKRVKLRTRPGAVLPDYGSVSDLDPVAGGTSAVRAARSDARGAVAPWLTDLSKGGLRLSGPSSNATLVTGRESLSGRPLAVMGPQVSYYSPQILLELDLEGGGFASRGAAFPGISLYVLLGRGAKYTWSATTATTDNTDEFVEQLCEPGGGRPTRASTSYVYKGRCIPMTVQQRTLRTPGPSLADRGARARDIKLELRRTVHGPVTRTATVRGRPVAIASARSTYQHELDSTIAFKRLSRNEVTDARSFERTMSRINFLFNWFYADERDIAFLQSGWFPLRAKGTDPSLPTAGGGRYDWQRFAPGPYTSRRASFARLPKEINPKRGYLISWNNKQAPGWRAADDQLGFNSVHRSQRLERRVRSAIRGSRRIDLPKLVSIMGDAGTVDLRGQEVYPWLRRVIGRPRNARERRLVGLLDGWVARGAHRVDRNGDNRYEDSGAVALMDAWWEPLVRAIYDRAVGPQLVARVRAALPFDDPPGPGGSAYFGGWYGYVQKDLRSLLGRRVRAPYSRRYCGNAKLRKGRGARRSRLRTLARCRAVVVRTLEAAAGAAERRYGAPLESLSVPATCPEATPPGCDQITFTATGALATPPIPWQDRGTFQQAVEAGR